MKLKSSIIMCCALTFCLSNCSKQQKAESLINDFIEQNITITGYEVECSPMDSTNRISTERIETMKRLANSDKLFKRNIKYGAIPTNNMYLYTQVKIINGKDTLKRTFYFDNTLKEVIAFKEN